MVEVTVSTSAHDRGETVTGKCHVSPIVSSATRWRHTVGHEHPQGRDHGESGRQAALETARRPDARQRSHPQAEVRGTGVHEHPFENVAVLAQMGPSQAAGVIEVGEGALEELAAPPHQPPAARALDVTPIRIDGVPLRMLIDPLLEATIRFADVGPQPCVSRSSTRCLL